MIIYRTISNHRIVGELRQSAEHLAKHVYPASEVIQAESHPDRARLILECGERLVGFEVLGVRLEEDAYEGMLRFAADLEAVRKKHSSRSVKDIELCLLAASSSDGFIHRIRKGMMSIQLYDWSSIRSDSGEEALLLRQVHPEIEENVERPAGTQPEASLRVQAQNSFHHPHQDFSESEKLAFQRFGLELSEKRARPEIKIPSK